MTRETDTAARLAILLVFLKNDNQALNVSRITTKLKEQGISKFTESSRDEAVPVEPTNPTVSAACQDLFSRGLLEMMVVRPPRSPGMRDTPHYFLPISDGNKARNTTEHLLKGFGPQLVNSTYGQTISIAVVQGIMEGVLEAYGINLTKNQRDNLASFIADSPEAMRRAMDGGLISSLRRLSRGRVDRESLVEALSVYLSAARTLDIADDNNRKETPCEVSD
jgi:hypothetical protein